MGYLRIALVGLFLTASAPAGAAMPSALAATIARIMANPRTSHATYALAIYDLDAKRIVYAHNAETFANAASTTKLVTEGATLTLLGPGFRWTTPVYRRGEVDSGGTLHGDLVLVASGDPNLSQRVRPNGTLAFENEDHAYDGSPETKAVPGDPLLVLRDLARHVKAAGISEIDGNVLVDTSLFPDSVEDGTGTHISPIVVNDNIIDVVVTPGARAGEPVTIAVSPATSYVSFVNHASTATAKTSATFAFADDTVKPDGSHVVTLTGSQPAGAPILYAYRVAEPKRFAELAFARALGEAGVRVVSPAADGSSPGPAAPTVSPSPAAPYSAAMLVARHVSPPVTEDTYVTLKVSQNLHAALMPYMWAVYGAHAKTDTLQSGFRAGGSALAHAGVDLDGASMQDGEGAATLFTPDFMVHYLAWAQARPWFPAFERALPIMGVDGTLVDIQRSSPARGKVFAKTGTIGESNLLRGGQWISKGLAGYLTTSHGRHLTFAFYLDHIDGPANENTGLVAGQILGSIATATYESL